MTPSHLEMQILAALEPGPLHGHSLVQAAQRHSPATLLSEGFYYEAIYSSELRGWVHSSRRRQGGCRPRLYRLTAKGLRRLRLARRAASRTRAAGRLL
ncbi:MAG TPA: helix-turn-helix transcriptional regulator [Acidobacteriota bacterium]|nr:helix-turn-helix transcriptional regulator [Acidobacteriota bacterium]